MFLLIFFLFFVSCNPGNKCYNTKSVTSVIEDISKKILILKNKQKEIERQLDLFQSQHTLLESASVNALENRDSITRMKNHIDELNKIQEDLNEWISILEDTIKVVKKFNGVSSRVLDQQLNGELAELLEMSQED